MISEHYKKTAVLIGLGTISASYEAGLRFSAGIDCRYVCDINPDAVSRNIYYDKEYVSDYLSLFKERKVELAIIATPPDTHAQIIRDCLDNCVCPIVEKPIAHTADIVSDLLQADGRFEVIFHWLHGSEVIWFTRNITLKDVKKIRISIKDPYADRGGRIRPEFHNKFGCWLDSGVNALSLLTKLVDLESFQPKSLSFAMDDSSGLPYRAICLMYSDRTNIEMDMRWDVEENHKVTFIEADGHEYVIDHTAQSVICDGVLVFKDDGMPRLPRHYFNYFANYPQSSTDWATNLLIHRKLYEAYDYQDQRIMA